MWLLYSTLCILEPTEDHDKVYYADINFHNHEEFPVLVHWDEMDKEMNETVPPGGSVMHNVLMKSAKQPNNSWYTAYNPVTMAVVKLNGKDHFKVTPTIEHNWVTINAGNPKGKCHGIVQDTL